MRPDQDYFEETRLGKPYDLKLLRRLRPFTRPHRRLIVWSVGLVVLITLLDLALPYVTKLAIDRYIVPGQESSKAASAENGDPVGRYLYVDPADPANLNTVTLPDVREDLTGELAHGYMEIRYLLQEDLRAALTAVIGAPDLPSDALADRAEALLLELVLRYAPTPIAYASALMGLSPPTMKQRLAARETP